MAELLVKASNAVHVDPNADRQGCYKRGYPVLVMPDGWQWGAQEQLPNFVVFKFPLIAVDNPVLLKWTQAWKVDVSTADGRIRRDFVQRRRWRVRWADLPQAAQDLILANGGLVIKATAAYSGPFDYTWAQVKAYFRNDETGLDETADP